MQKRQLENQQLENQRVENQQAPRPVMIVAAGTGGHVFPALAIAEALMEGGVPVVWLGTPTGFEVSVVKQAGIAYESISMSGLRGKGWASLVTAPLKLLKAIVQSIAIVARLKPSLMLTMGGYVTAPAGLAAKLKGVPLILHEQNAIPGLANQWLAPLSKVVFSGFPNALSKHKDFRCVGNPLRQSLVASAKQVNPLQDNPLEDNREAVWADIRRGVRSIKLLVVGGSLGARTLNQWVPTALSEMAPELRPQVWHQTGEQGYEATQAAYRGLNLDAKIEPFITEMSEAYAWADLIICRAGAMTTSEVMAMAIPALFVPYPYAVDDHQRANAETLVTLGSAEMLVEKESDASQLRDLLNDFVHNPEKLDKMRQAALAQRHLDAQKTMVDYIVSQLNQ